MYRKISVYRVLLVLMITLFNVFSFPLIVSIGVNLLVLFLSGALKYKEKRQNKITQIMRTLILLTAYTLFVCLLNFNFPEYTIQKPIRMIVFYSLFILISKAFAYYSNEEIIIGIVFAFLLHLSCVYLQFFIPEMKPIFASFLRTDGNEDAITGLALRSFGLDASFDGSGLCLCFLLLVLLLLFINTKRLLFFGLGLLTLIGCFMVGRTAMAVGALLMLVMVLKTFRVNRGLFFFAIIIGVSAFFYVYDYAVAFYELNDDGQSYRMETVTRLTTSSMLYLPTSIFGTLIGTAELPENSDIGYIKIIHMIGVVGLIFVLAWYFQMLKCIKFYKRFNPPIFYGMVFFLLLLLAYNYKLLLLYSRGINDLFILLVFVLIRKQSIIESNYSSNENNKISRIQ